MVSEPCGCHDCLVNRDKKHQAEIESLKSQLELDQKERRAEFEKQFAKDCAIKMLNQLQAERDRLRAALEKIAGNENQYTRELDAVFYKRIAREALGEK